MSELYERADVFLSHSSKDDIFVRMLRGYLRAHNIEAWIDDDRFGPFMAVDEETTDANIREGISGARYFIVIVSKNSLQSEAVAKEVTFAKARRQEVHDIEVLGLVIDDTRLEDAPEWLKDIRMSRFSVVPTDDKLNPQLSVDEDPLKTLRDEIGRGQPLYISKVQPYFFKQVLAGTIGPDLSETNSQTISLWFVNGGFSLQANYPEAIRRIATKSPGAEHIEALFLDSAHLKTGGFWRFMSRQRQSIIDQLISSSGKTGAKGDHAEQVRKSAEILRSVAKDANCTLDVRLTEKLPTGRFLFLDELTVFAPYTMPHNSEEPAFLMNINAPFSKVSRRLFTETFDAARPFLQVE